jgi:hypothetical protein
MAGQVRTFLAKDLREMAAPTLYFALVLNLLVLTVALLSDDHVLSAISHASACVGALLVGKAFLLADRLPIIERKADHPVLICALWATGVYYVVATLLHVAERLISAALDSRGFLFRAKEDAAGFDMTMFVVVQVWMLFLLAVFALGRELRKRVGRDRIRDYLIRVRPAG